MKNIILLIFIFTSLIKISFAQPPAPGSNIVRPYLDKFQGTWKWTNGNSEVIIKLKKINYYFEALQIHEDILIGSHKYINNGVVVEDYLSEFVNISQTNLSSIFLWANMDGSEIDKISGDLKDIPKYKKALLNLDFIDGTTPKLSWFLQAPEGTIVYPTLGGVTLPRNLILIKQ